MIYFILGAITIYSILATLSIIGFLRSQKRETPTISTSHNLTTIYTLLRALDKNDEILLNTEKAVATNLFDLIQKIDSLAIQTNQIYLSMFIEENEDTPVEGTPKSVKSFIHSLEFVRDKYTTTKTQKEVLNNIISKIKKYVGDVSSAK